MTDHDKISEVFKASCANCGRSLKEDFKFCPECGQTRKSLRITLGSLIKQSLGDLFSYDSKLWHSLVPLIIKPGYLTKQYLEGKRVRYIPPIRLYIFISLIYFIIMGINLDTEDLTISSKPQDRNMVEIFQDSVKTTVIENTSPDDGTYLSFGEKEVSMDTLEQWIVDEREHQLVDSLGWKNTRMNNYLAKLIVQKSVKAFGEPGYWIRQMVTAASYLMFVMMPLLAVFLMMLFYKNKNYFTEHLIHSFHLHAFIFICLTLFLLLPNGIQKYYALILPFIFSIYLYKSLIKVYERTKLSTFLKLLFLLFSGGVAMIFLIIGSFLLSFLFV